MSKFLNKLRHEPVAVWGAVFSAALVIAGALGVSATWLATAGAVLSILGIPVVRSQVTPTKQ